MGGLGRSLRPNVGRSPVCGPRARRWQRSPRYLVSDEPLFTGTSTRRPTHDRQGRPVTGSARSRGYLPGTAGIEVGPIRFGQASPLACSCCTSAPRWRYRREPRGAIPGPAPTTHPASMAAGSTGPVQMRRRARDGLADVPEVLEHLELLDAKGCRAPCRLGTVVLEGN